MTSDNDTSEQTAKRRKVTGRRKVACQTCSLRKTKCDTTRPACSSCSQTGSECIYLTEPDDSLTLNRAVEILSGQINALADRLDTIGSANGANGSNGTNGFNGARISREVSISQPFDDTPVPSNGTGSQPSLLPDLNDHLQPQPSRDFSHIPAHQTTADEVLTWPIFESAFPSNYLIDPHLGYRLSTGGIFEDDPDSDGIVLGALKNIAPLEEHRIPSLVDRFLENVHTKNPVLDVEALVRKSREYASRGLCWDSYSCLLLTACALGLVAKPFGSELEALDTALPLEMARQIAAPAKERDQADHCFVQASRRLGSLRPSILAAQCNFFAGVYLMYTLRPMLSWQYFHQASITYQLYLKMQGRISDDNVVLMYTPGGHMRGSTRTTRMEQRLYWSCFKSEAEFRIELPLPQSEIAVYEFPNLFPSPPSPLATDIPTAPRTMSKANSGNGQTSTLSISQMLSEDHDEVRQHAKRLCNEEESWYYYLTEVALRRIGNRVINTFFRQERSAWMSIERQIDIAIEFESQVSTWKTNLPPAMQKYETNSTIRAPRMASPGGAEAGFVSRELSWATENRLLEMRHWLYQPFLYYLVHARPATPTAPGNPRGSFSSSGRPGTDQEFWSMINRAIDCNLTILDTRSVPHRHHGLWYDLRALVCSSLLLLSVVKAGYESLIPGGRQTLIGDPAERSIQSNGFFHNPVQTRSPQDVQLQIHGKFGRVLRQLEIWSHESADMIRAREVLEVLISQILLNTK